MCHGLVHAAEDLGIAGVGHCLDAVSPDQCQGTHHGGGIHTAVVFAFAHDFGPGLELPFGKALQVCLAVGRGTVAEQHHAGQYGSACFYITAGGARHTAAVHHIKHGAVRIQRPDTVPDPVINHIDLIFGYCC